MALIVATSPDHSTSLMTTPVSLLNGLKNAFRWLS